MNAQEARDGLAAAERRLTESFRPSNGDPATARLSGPALAQAHRTTDRDLARSADTAKAVEAAKFRLALAEAAERERQRTRLIAADLAGATHVRDRHGWHRVVRVNRTTVTVDTAHSWTDRIPVDRVLEARGGR